MTQEEKNDDGRAELIIGWILRVGVVVSLATILLGTAVSFIGDARYRTDHEALQPLISGSTEFPHTIPEILRGAAHFRGEGLVMLGLLLLIATPILRVAASVWIFFLRRDWAFAIITAVVLGLLLLAMLAGRVE